MKTTTTLAEAFAEICALDAPLNARLAAYAEKLRELNFPFAEAYDNLVSRLLAGEVGSAAPDVGEIMPDFVLPARGGRLVSLDDVTATGPVVISFNRGHWCPFCKIELLTIAEHHTEIKAAGAEVVSIIPDRQEFLHPLHASTFNRLHILTDVENGYSLSLGLAVWLGDVLKDLMRGRGYHLDTYHGSDGWFVPLPATFVVAKDKTIIARLVDPDFRRRMDVVDILKALNEHRRRNDTA